MDKFVYSLTLFNVENDKIVIYITDQYQPFPHKTRITFTYKNSHRRIQNQYQFSNIKHKASCKNQLTHQALDCSQNKPLKFYQIHRKLLGFMRLTIACL